MVHLRFVEALVQPIWATAPACLPKHSLLLLDLSLAQASSISLLHLPWCTHSLVTSPSPLPAGRRRMGEELSTECVEIGFSCREGDEREMVCLLFGNRKWCINVQDGLYAS